MKVGDLIKKMRGELDRHRSGIIIEIKIRTGANYTIVTVLVDGEIKNWAAHLTEVQK